jgi:ribosomal protein L37AE/L43A
MKKAKRKYIIDVCPECKVRENDSSKKRLYKCPFCERYFCKKHLAPRLAMMRSAIEEIKDPVLKDKIYEEWRKKDGHPDWAWTEKYFEKIKVEEERKRERFWEAVGKLKETKEKEEIPKYLPSIPSSSIESISKFLPRKPSFKFKYVPEPIDSLVWLGLIICLISLFLPWISVSFLGFPIESTWLSLFQAELPKIQTNGLLNYIKTSHYVAIAMCILPILGFMVVIIGLLTKNWIIFTGSLFLLLSPLTILYFLSQGMNVFGVNVSFISLAGIGLWGFLVGSLLLAYGSAKQISGPKIFSSLIIVGIISGIFLSNFSLSSESKIGQPITGSYSYPYKEVKSLIEKTIKDYLTPKEPWIQRSVNDLKYLGPIFSGSFNGYSICASGTYSCDYGKEKGENINYLYCRPSAFSFYIFCYKKVITSTSGEIQNIIKNCVYNFVLDPKNLEVVSINFGSLHQTAESLC